MVGMKNGMELPGTVVEEEPVYRYRVYIIDLKKSVMKDRRFRERNPQYREGAPCVYVGSTGRPVDVRFQQHLADYKANRYARDYGKRLRTGDMKAIRPRRTSGSIVRKECQVAQELQERGWGVWWH